MGKGVIVMLVLLVLVAGLAGSVYAGYNGYGMVMTGGPSARVGSIGGPLVIGGGPGSGK
jgi:hypothetical protein